MYGCKYNISLVPRWCGLGMRLMLHRNGKQTVIRDRYQYLNCSGDKTRINQVATSLSNSRFSLSILLSNICC